MHFEQNSRMFVERKFQTNEHKKQSMNNIIECELNITITYSTIYNLYSRNFLRSPRRLHEFQLADAEAWNKKNNHIIVVFKEKLSTNELTPEILTYKTMGLCIECCKNSEELAAKIR